MRKLFNFFLPVLILSIGFVSCEKDDVDDVDDVDEIYLSSSSDLLGTWKLVGITVNSKINGKSSPAVNVNTEQEILEIVDFVYFCFIDDGRYYVSEKKLDQIPIEDESDEGGWEEGEWEIYKGNLYLDGDKVPVTELSSNKMIWVMTETDTYEDDLYEVNMKFSLSKVK